MQEVRVESLEKLELAQGQVRLSANSGALSIVFPREVWDSARASVPASEEPDAAELEELADLREQLQAYASEKSFGTVVHGARCGESGLEFDLVLKPGGLFALTTGYHFAPEVGTDLMSRVRAGLANDESVEQAYVIGAVVSPEALAAGDDNLKALSVRGRRCSASRFEMAPELWHTLHERLGWDNVETP